MEARKLREAATYQNTVREKSKRTGKMRLLCENTAGLRAPEPGCLFLGEALYVHGPKPCNWDILYCLQ